MAKTQKSVRLSKRAVDQLDELVKRTGLNQTEIISTGIDRMYQEVVFGKEKIFYTAKDKDKVEVKVDSK